MTKEKKQALIDELGILKPEVAACPAPTVSLADLLPTYDEIRAEAGSYGEVYSLEQKQRFLDGGMWVCAAILRNIEAAK